jgi:hypothetical protein
MFENTNSGGAGGGSSSTSADGQVTIDITEEAYGAEEVEAGDGYRNMWSLNHAFKLSQKPQPIPGHCTPDGTLSYAHRSKLID